MYLRFIKFHLIVFEIISLAMSIIAVIGLVYYSFFFKNYTGLQENGAKIIDISFNSSIKESTFGDISINLYLPNMTNCTNAYIILSIKVFFPFPPIFEVFVDVIFLYDIFIKVIFKNTKKNKIKIIIVKFKVFAIFLIVVK